jgi:hypothetical protein
MYLERDGLNLKYKLLQAEMVSGKDRELASAVSSFVLSGDDAYKLAGHQGFAYKVIDQKGRCGVVTYNGIEISLLFKREIIEREPWPSEPIPVSALHDPKDAWLRIDLLDISEIEKHKGLSEKLRQSMERNERLQLLWVQEKNQREQLQAEAKKWEDEKLELKRLREKVALMERERSLR